VSNSYKSKGNNLMIENIGIVGGGQLGRMLTEAAHPLGYQVTVVEASPDCPATKAGANYIQGGLKDADAIRQLAEQTDVVTWEIEHIDTSTLIDLASEGYNVQPSPSTLAVIQDKFTQKQMLIKAGLPVAESLALSHQESDTDKATHLDEVVRMLGGAVILKTKTGGYDGRGNLLFDGDYARVDEVLGSDWGNVYAERIVPFEKELSVVAARDMQGNIAIYPTAETVHKDNICHTVVTPARIRPKLIADAQEIAHETLKQLEGAGIFAIEMFATEDEVIINEIAPRVHNSGHHTIEANVTSQFEQHVRAITGMPLGSTAMRSPAAAMINILGQREEPLTREGMRSVLALPDTHPHFYGKSSRKARKIGHITVLGSSVEEVLRTANQARGELTV
jgi:phosphoribosylaminoimidazole carboxylase PurK protein